MTLARRVQDVERRMRGRRREPAEMTTAELWAEVMAGIEHVPDAELQAAIGAVRASLDAGESVLPQHGEQLLRRLALHIPTLAP